MHPTIPFLDLVTPHRELEQEFIAVFREALESGRFIGGPQVEDFEKEFASFCDTRHCIGVGSGTDALRFALLAAGIKRGEIVVTVPNTFIATTEAISQAGAQAEFVDIDERTYTMHPARLDDFLSKECRTDPATGKTVHTKTGRIVRAVIPVHLYGQVADMDPIMNAAERHNLIVIEDACQAQGAEYFSKRENRWKKAGSIGVAAAFSFYPGKNLGACGEAGAVTTNDAGIAEKVRMLRDHGQFRKYHHEIEGYNGRLDAVQAGILRIKLRRLNEWNEDRRRLARRYDRLLSAIEPVTVPFEPEWSRAVYHLYVIRAPKRDALQIYLSERKISTALHYPVPLHLQKAYAGRKNYNGSLAITESAALQILSLPMFPGLNEEQQLRVVEGIRAFYRQGM